MSISSIVKTDAITLRVSPFSNTSHVVTWLTPAHGKVATVIKGACRPKSLASGQYDIGYLCELLYYEREYNGVHIYKECAVLNPRRSCRGNWRHSAVLGYLCYLASIATPDGGHAMDLYQILYDALSTLERDIGDESCFLMLPWFELRLLTILGIAPQLKRCVICNAPDEAGVAQFSTQHGGRVCSRCGQSRGNISDCIPLHRDIAAILTKLQEQSRFDALRTLRCSTPQQIKLRRILGDFLCYYLDMAQECRAVPYQMLNATG